MSTDQMPPVVELLDHVATSTATPGSLRVMASSASTEIKRLHAERKELLAHLDLLPGLGGSGLYAARTRDVLWRHRKRFQSEAGDRFALELLLEELEDAS